MTSRPLAAARAFLRATARTTAYVLRQPRWLLGSLAVSLGLLALVAVVDSSTYVRRVVVGGDLSISARVAAFWSVFPLPSSSPYPAVVVVLYVVAGLVGIGLMTVLCYATNGGDPSAG